jgi:hypothetical protein
MRRLLVFGLSQALCCEAGMQPGRLERRPRLAFLVVPAGSFPLSSRFFPGFPDWHTG